MLSGHSASSLLGSGPTEPTPVHCTTQNAGDHIDEIDDLNDLDEIEDIDDLNDLDEIEDIDDLDEELEAGHHHGDVVEHAGEVPGRGSKESGTVIKLKLIHPPFDGNFSLTD